MFYKGCNAEFVLVDERLTGRKPKSLNWEEAASVPLCTLTAWEALLEGLKIPRGILDSYYIDRLIFLTDEMILIQ